MDKAVDFLRSELKNIRTGRASSGLVENIMVEYYGNPTPLNAVIGFSETMRLQPFGPIRNNFV